MNAKNRLFLGCFIALITTAFGFITRIFLLGGWGKEFGLDDAEAGRLLGIGIWPFAVSIIGFSLFIDKIGYKTAMYFAFLGHMIWAVMGVSAFTLSAGTIHTFTQTQGGKIEAEFVSVRDGLAQLKGTDGKTQAVTVESLVPKDQEFVTAQKARKDLAYALLYWGSLILALANGTVEAFINPVVATVFSKEKTKWLNILHAGWPGGLVIAGIIVIFMGNVGWGWKVGIIGLPAIIYLLMLLPSQFPVSERVASKVSYRDMLSEFGILGAAVVGFLITLQLIDFASQGGHVPSIGTKLAFAGIGVAIVAAFGAYTKSFGRPLLFFLILIMMPLATTEIGTDGWITSIMEGAFEMTPQQVTDAGGIDKVLVINSVAYRLHPGWVLVYTSVIMMLLRFCAGPIVHTLSPLGLLAISSVLAIIGLYTLSFTMGMTLFAAATLYAFGKTFFWPTMLGVVAEQCPRGGALTLNGISGIGMLAVGTLGGPYIGSLQEASRIQAVAASDEINTALPELKKDGKLTVLADRSIYQIIRYQAIDNKKLNELVAKLPATEQAAVKAQIAKVSAHSKQGALANMALFPVIMLAGYLILIGYFASRGGYKAQVLVGHAAEDNKYTGGVEGPMEA